MKKKKKMLQKKKKLQMRLSKKAPTRLADKTSDLADENLWKKESHRSREDDQFNQNFTDQTSKAEIKSSWFQGSETVASWPARNRGRSISKRRI